MIGTSYKRLKLLFISLSVCLGMLWTLPQVQAQAIIQVRVLTARVLNSEDCDGIFSGDSDFVFEFSATANLIDYTNNNPTTCALIGQGTNTVHRNGNNGPWTENTPTGAANPNDGIFFNHDCICVPTQMNMYWTGYENDNVCDFDLGGILQEGTVTENFTIPVPAGPGSSGPVTRTLSSGGGCNQTYEITFEVIRSVSPTVLTFMEDNICDAGQIPLNSTQTYGLVSRRDFGAQRATPQRRFCSTLPLAIFRCACEW